ncbi:MAG TPA: hypothetical protein VKL21_00815 [Candidatus Methanoperedens sp.]|nr:hypothetical protein [Candidatus Methanoperedens sp.]
MKTNEDIQELNKQALLYSKDLEAIIQEMHRVIIGQESVIEKLILALVADGHMNCLKPRLTASCSRYCSIIPHRCRNRKL